MKLGALAIGAVLASTVGTVTAYADPTDPAGATPSPKSAKSPKSPKSNAKPHPAKPTPSSKAKPHGKKGKAVPEPDPDANLEVIEPEAAKPVVVVPVAPVVQAHDGDADGAAPVIGIVVAPAAPPAEPKQHHWYVRVGAALLAPASTSSPMTLSGVDGAASLAISNGPIAGSGASVGAAVLPAAILGYRLPWLDGKLSLETVLGLPFTVKFHATGTLESQSIAPTALGIPTGVPALGPDLGQATAAPPMLTAVYQLPHLGPLRPLVGAGAAILFALNPKITNPTLTAVSQPTFNVPPAPGLVLQGALEAAIAHNIYVRLDLKFIAFMEARATVENIQVNTPGLPLFGTVGVGSAKMDVFVNPFVIQAGIGIDFW